jgi:C4-type Zn-finger protein
MSLTPRQIRINARLYDKLQTLRFTKVSDRQQAAKLMTEIIEEIDQVVQGELDLTTKGKTSASN